MTKLKSNDHAMAGNTGQFEQTLLPIKRSIQAEINGELRFSKMFPASFIRSRRQWSKAARPTSLIVRSSLKLKRSYYRDRSHNDPYN